MLVDCSELSSPVVSTTDIPESAPGIIEAPSVQVPVKSPPPGPSNENMETPVTDPSKKEHLILEMYLEDPSQTEFDQREMEYISFISRMANVNATLIRVRFGKYFSLRPCIHGAFMMVIMAATSKRKIITVISLLQHLPPPPYLRIADYF